MPARGRLFAGRRRSQRPAKRVILRYRQRGNEGSTNYIWYETLRKEQECKLCRFIKPNSHMYVAKEMTLCQLKIKIIVLKFLSF